MISIKKELLREVVKPIEQADVMVHFIWDFEKYLLESRS
jgi:hypothetical protein